MAQSMQRTQHVGRLAWVQVKTWDKFRKSQRQVARIDEHGLTPKRRTELFTVTLARNQVQNHTSLHGSHAAQGIAHVSPEDKAACPPITPCRPPLSSPRSSDVHQGGCWIHRQPGVP